MKYLNIPYLHKDIVKKYGAKFDFFKKKWYCEDDNNPLCNMYDEILKGTKITNSFFKLHNDININNKNWTTEYCYDINKNSYLLNRGGLCNSLINNREYSKEWRKRNADKIYKHSHKYYLNNINKIKYYHKIYDSKYYLNHIDKKKEYNKNYYKKNKQKMKEQIKESQERNKEKIKEYQRNYNKTDKRKQYKREYYLKNIKRDENN